MNTIIAKANKTATNPAKALGNPIFSNKFTIGKSNIDSKTEKYKGTNIDWHRVIINTMSNTKSN